MKQFKIVLLAFMATSFLISCAKTSTNERKTDNNSSASQSRSGSIRPLVSFPITVDSNSNNPYDYVGAQHNAGCSVLQAEINPSSPTLDADILLDDKDFLVSKSYDTLTFDTIYDYITANGYYAIPDSPYGDNPTILFTSMYNNGLISLNTKNYLTTFDEIVSGYVTSDTPTQTVYNTVATQISEVEHQISLDTHITSNEQAALLMTGSVYRYSGAYWGSYILNTGTETAKFSWKGLFKRDAAGAIAGAIGAFTKVHTLASAGIGAIGGGLGSSIAYAIVGN